MAFAPLHDPDSDSLDLFRHELKSPLTVIRGQAQLLRRRVSRLDGIDERDRAWLLERGAHIESAVLLPVALIDGIGQEPRKPPAEDDPGD